MFQVSEYIGELLTRRQLCAHLAHLPSIGETRLGFNTDRDRPFARFELFILSVTFLARLNKIFAIFNI